MSHDTIWRAIRDEVTVQVADEPLLASFLHMTVLRHSGLADVLAFQLSSKLACNIMDARVLMELFHEAYLSEPKLVDCAREDICAHYDRDPACDFYSTPLLYFKGFHAIQCYRVTHWLWKNGRHTLAVFLQNRISEVASVDIHPAARIGAGIMLDHGTGFVVGATAVVGDNVSILQGVTLGGTGKNDGDRHPKIGAGVLLGAGAKVLGNILVGDGAKIGAGSVVLEDVPAHMTAAGVPARIVGDAGCMMPAWDMDQGMPHVAADMP